MTSRTAATAAALLAATGVALGAFGAHALRSRLTDRDLEIFETAVRYQMYHAFGLFVAAALIGRGAAPAVGAAWAFLAGITLFAGSLYLMVFTGARWLGAVTPLGGAALIVGWVMVALAARRA